MRHPHDVNVTYGKSRFLAYLSSFVDKQRRNQPGSHGLLFYFLTQKIKNRLYLVFKKILWISSLVNGAHVQKATRFYYFPITSRTNKGNFSLFSSPVRKYRKSYCNHVGVGVRVAQMLKFFIKVFRSLYLLNMSMDQVDTLHVVRYWSEVLCSTIMTHPG